MHLLTRCASLSDKATAAEAFVIRMGRKDQDRPWAENCREVPERERRHLG
jgi:hypothetical protein